MHHVAEDVLGCFWVKLVSRHQRCDRDFGMIGDELVAKTCLCGTNCRNIFKDIIIMVLLRDLFSIYQRPNKGFCVSANVWMVPHALHNIDEGGVFCVGSLVLQYIVALLHCWHMLQQWARSGLGLNHHGELGLHLRVLARTSLSEAKTATESTYIHYTHYVSMCSSHNPHCKYTTIITSTCQPQQSCT